MCFSTFFPLFLSYFILFHFFWACFFFSFFLFLVVNQPADAAKAAFKPSGGERKPEKRKKGK